MSEIQSISNVYDKEDNMDIKKKQKLKVKLLSKKIDIIIKDDEKEYLLIKYIVKIY